MSFHDVGSPVLLYPLLSPPVIGRMTYSGGFGPGVPPLPIPNREVKPGRADGTAPQCGRVGRRLLERGGSLQRCGEPPLFFQFLCAHGKFY